MRNTIEIDGYRAVIQYDPEIEMFRGEFVGLNGGADFYAADAAGLRREGAKSLEAFLEMCPGRWREPRRQYSGRFNVRLPPELHADIAIAAAADGKSIDQWVTEEVAIRGCGVKPLAARPYESTTAARRRWPRSSRC